jgi:hypothetical protein
MNYARGACRLLYQLWPQATYHLPSEARAPLLKAPPSPRRPRPPPMPMVATGGGVIFTHPPCTFHS